MNLVVKGQTDHSAFYRWDSEMQDVLIAVVAATRLGM
jgi:hypothetical protein